MCWISRCYQNTASVALGKVLLQVNARVIGIVNYQQPLLLKIRKSVHCSILVWLDLTEFSDLGKGLLDALMRTSINPEYTPETYGVGVSTFY